jgi:hypothetical protein
VSFEVNVKVTDRNSLYCTLTTPHVFPADDLHDARNTITEQNRRLHELEIELRRLENEREELSAAYKEAEAVSVR